MALSQWLLAVFTAMWGMAIAPVLEPPAPQNRSVRVRVIGVPFRRRGSVLLLIVYMQCGL
jgi:hypothetical protein